jgi:hypothetical protein
MDRGAGTLPAGKNIALPATLRASLAAFALLTAPLAARAAEGSATPVAPAPENLPATATSPFQGLSDNTCLAWNDGCRTCRREADNTVSCSNIGIACQPSADICTARREPPK